MESIGRLELCEYLEGVDGFVDIERLFSSLYMISRDVPLK